MTAWVALLRAINVSGKNVIPMADMRELMATLGFENVVTHLASGNVLLRSDQSADELATVIHDGIEDRFGYDVHVLARSQDDLATLIANVPWEYPANSSSGVVFLSGPMSEPLDFARFDPDQAVMADIDMYVDCPTGFGKTKMTVAWIEKQTGLAGTRRNWKTVRALHDKLGELA